MADETARELESLHHGILRCRKCPLHESRQHAVPGEGDPHAALLLIGEAPGAKEDEQGRPFVGPAGDQLDELFGELNMDRADAFITSSVKCRPPGNRNPHAAELETCRDAWLLRQMELVDPDVVLLLGRIAARQVLDERRRLREVRGRVREQDGRRYLITYHPAAAMRFPEAADGAAADFRKLKRLLAGL